MKENAICIITARGGSKRIPRKNIRDFCGKPIICYSIEAALKSGLFDEVMVSTDSIEIAEISKTAGASVPFMRSPETSGDFATTDDVNMEVLRNYRNMGRVFDTMCNIYPTAPFVTSEKLIKAYGIMISMNADSVMPVVRFSFPPQRGVRIIDGVCNYISPEDYSKRSQDIEPIYHDAGQFYFYRIKSDGTFNYMTPVAIVVDELEVQDIDNYSDWQIAEMKYRIMTMKNHDEN